MKAPRARWTCAAIAAAWGAAAAYFMSRALPLGMRLEGAPQAVPTANITFLDDITGADAYGHGFSTHAIFDAMLRNIGAARGLVVLDYHLCNDLHRNAADAIAPLTPMAAQMMEALLARKAAVPELQVLVIADPINGLYGAGPAGEFARLRAAGIQVVTADLAALRDRNFLIAEPWRLTLKWWSHPDSGGGWLPNPFSDSGPPLTARAWAQLANLKSSDRRVLIADDGHGALTALAGTAEPAMASSIHTVTALEVTGPVVKPLLNSELQLARGFGWNGTMVLPTGAPTPTSAGTLTFQWLAEGDR